MAPVDEMQTAPLKRPGILNPTVLAVTAAETLSAVGLLDPPFT